MSAFIHLHHFNCPSTTKQVLLHYRPASQSQSQLSRWSHTTTSASHCYVALPFPLRMHLAQVAIQDSRTVEACCELYDQGSLTQRVVRTSSGAEGGDDQKVRAISPKSFIFPEKGISQPMVFYRIPNTAGLTDCIIRYEIGIIGLSFVSSLHSVDIEQCKNLTARIMEIADKTYLPPASCRTIATCKGSRMSPPGIEPGSPWAKHDNRPNCIYDERSQAVHKHIRSIPVYQTHYSRIQNPTLMYFDTTDDEKKDYYRKRSKLHLRRTDTMKDKIKEYTTKVKEGPENVHAISINVQQTIPTPKLTCVLHFF
ncbi:hypothetical protein PR048_006016 [Dryococelus australis]|uniref:Uncharacterized protein n=1 Tax=Dryococelus australis TaxID=614101 RepID=A0ABQ9IAZ8_9NEOP|nr:hypothetical protein PR048_006016 [Dryococelus australis]